MTGILYSIGVSVGLVILEYLALFWAKSRVCLLSLDNEAQKLYQEGFKQNRSKDELDKEFEKIKKSRFNDVTLQIIPGPEMCFMALTILACLLLIVPSINENLLKELSPAFLSASHATEQLFLMFLLTVCAWIGTAHWRERIATKIQTKIIGLSIFAIIGIGGAALGFCCYIFIGGR